MIGRIIEFSVRRRWLIILAWAAVAFCGVLAIQRTPVDAIPDLSENQVIVYAHWMGHGAQDIEVRVTRALCIQLQGLAGVKAIRASSEFNFSMINVIFEDNIRPGEARRRVLERVMSCRQALPPDVYAGIGPDASALGQVFWYTVEGDGRSLDELHAVQNFTVRYALSTIPGVAEVANVGGLIREFHIDVDPRKLRAFNVTLNAVASAVQGSNRAIGGHVMETTSTEYVLRGMGWLDSGGRAIEQLENIQVTSSDGVQLRLHDVATVQFGPAFRRGALEKNGQEAVGGVVIMRDGQNPRRVIAAVKDKIRGIQSSLPAGVRIVPFYDRIDLIDSAISTVTHTLWEEMIIASIAVLLILTHVRSAIIVCVTLPLAVLTSFLLMYVIGQPSNIMSLCGIAISIGVLVDASVVMVENATHELRRRWGADKVRGDTAETVIAACRMVGRPIFLSVLIMLISFLPVFFYAGQEGKLSHPLACTKSFAMVGVAIVAITLVPALIALLIRGRLGEESRNVIVRSFADIYRPTLLWVMDRPGFVWWMMACIMLLGAGFLGNSGIVAAIMGLGLVAVYLSIVQVRWRAAAVVTLLVMALVADRHLPRLGSEFMPELDEGAIVDMPVTAPRVSMRQALDDVAVRNRVLRSLPEAQTVVGKVGRAETATDPSPLDMVETMVELRPRDQWPKRAVRHDDALHLAAVAAARMQESGWLGGARLTARQWSAAADAATGDIGSGSAQIKAASALLGSATDAAIQRFDRALRQVASTRLEEEKPRLAKQLAGVALDDLLHHAAELPALNGAAQTTRDIRDSDRDKLLATLNEQGLQLAERPRQETVDALLNSLVHECVAAHILPDRADLLAEPSPDALSPLSDVRDILGLKAKDFPQKTLQHLEQARSTLLAARVRELNWELRDAGIRVLSSAIVEELAAAAQSGDFAGAKSSQANVRALADKIASRHANGLLLWTKTHAELVEEMNAELQMPGWANIWTQPIINRVNMLATGVRTEVGVKVLGPLGQPLEAARAQTQQIAEKVASRLRNVSGAANVQVDQSGGKRYVVVKVDPDQARRFGVNMTELLANVETVLGGTAVTTTAVGTPMPVIVRMIGSATQSPEALGDVPIAAATLPDDWLDTAIDTHPMKETAPATAPATTMTDRPTHAGLIALRHVASIASVDGPSMIKSENGQICSYVTLNVRGRDPVSFVQEARQAIEPVEKELAGTGTSLVWTGEYENQLHARRTMTVIFPVAVALIVVLLYLTLHQLADVLLVVLAVIGALSGAIAFQAAFGFNFSVIVSIGYIAAFGMATQTGVIMLVYLREAIERLGGINGIGSLRELRQAVVAGAVHRLRPKLLTEGVAIVGLVPMLWASGTGAEVMRPMAAPVLGGLLIADEVIDLMIPVLFYWLRRRAWLRRAKLKPVSPSEHTGSGLQTTPEMAYA